MQHPSIPQPGSQASIATSTLQRLNVVPLGLSLATFFVITYLLCVLLGFVLPLEPMHRLLPMLLPGFTWLTWSAFFIGLAWAFFYGWYVALIFVPLYNFFAVRCDVQRRA